MLSMRDLIPWSRHRDVVHGRSDFEHPFLAFQHEADRLFEDFLRGFDLPMVGRFERGRTFVSPRLDVSETAAEIVVTVELPGMTEDDIEVLVGADSLTLKGEKRIEHDEGEGAYSYRERTVGAFRRTLPIDADILADKIEATFANGILEIKMPKNPDSAKKVRKIAVKGEPEKTAPEKKVA